VRQYIIQKGGLDNLHKISNIPLENSRHIGILLDRSVGGGDTPSINDLPEFEKRYQKWLILAAKDYEKVVKEKEKVAKQLEEKEQAKIQKLLSMAIPTVD